MSKFPTTQWTQLAEATLNGGIEARQALEALCQRYWQPVYHSICVWRRDIPAEEARDLTQEFLLHTMEHSLFRKAERDLHGKFRSYLKGALRRYVFEKVDRLRARNARNGMVTVPLHDDMQPAAEGEDPIEADVVFDREWALATMESALQRVRKECEDARGAAHFEVLKPFLPGGHGPPDYVSAASRLGCSQANVRLEVHRVRKRFRQCLRAEVARTVSAPHEVEEELQHLKRVLLNV